MYIFIVIIDIQYGAVYFSANIRQQNLREGTETLPYNIAEKFLFVMGAYRHKICAVCTVIKLFNLVLFLF